MNNSGYYDNDMCEGDMCDYNEGVDDLMDNIETIPQSQPDFDNRNKKSNRFDPSSITDARQIPTAKIAYSENSNGDHIPSVFIGNTPYPITSFIPSVIAQIQERQDRPQQPKQQPSNPAYNAEMIQLEQAKPTAI